MYLAKLLAISIFCLLHFYDSAVAIEVMFEEVDQSFREGREFDVVFLQKGETDDDVAVLIQPLSVSEFREYCSNNTGRIFLSNDSLESINNIIVYAEAGMDFNSSVIRVMFPANATELPIVITEVLIFDDNVNELEEGFVLLLEVDQPNNVNSDALRFNIIDNDDVNLGFNETFFIFNESVGVLVDTFKVIILEGITSEQDLNIMVTIIDENSQFINESVIVIPPGQMSVFIDPIEIIDDTVIEGDETFFIELSVGPEAQGYAIRLDRMTATVVIIDNEVTPSPSPDLPSPSPSESPTSPPSVNGIGGDPHYSIMLPSGKLLCFSVHGEKDFPFNLISNDLLQMNAFFIEDALRDEITWIGSLGVVVQHAHYKKSNTTKIRFEAKDQMIYINNGVSLHARKVEKLSLANGRLSVTEAVRKDVDKKPEVQVDLVDVGLTFSVRFVKKRHLDMSWNKVVNQPSNSHGIIGQFLRKGVEIDETRKLLYLPSLDPVPVMRSSVWHFMERESPDQEQQLCWQAMNPGYQGKRLIEGSYLDYLVDDVLTSDFQFKK